MAREADSKCPIMAKIQEKGHENMPHAMLFPVMEIYLNEMFQLTTGGGMRTEERTALTIVVHRT